MYDILEQLYVFFSRSCKRSAVLRENLQEVENALQLRNLSKTRWVYRSESIDEMWRSFSAVKDALDTLSSLRSVDKPTRDDNASRLFDHVVNFNFMFMKITKILTMEMQKIELNILDALTLIEQAVTSLERIRASESDMNSQIDASVQFAKTHGLDPQVEFSQKRQRKPSRRIDANPSTSAAIQFHPYYRECMIELLDSLIREYKDDIKDCLEKVKPLAEALVLPNHHLKKLTVEEAEAISEIFPPSVAVNPVCLVLSLKFLETSSRMLRNLVWQSMTFVNWLTTTSRSFPSV